MAGKVVSKESTLNEEVIDVLTYWFGTAYWSTKVNLLCYVLISLVSLGQTAFFRFYLWWREKGL